MSDCPDCETKLAHVGPTKTSRKITELLENQATFSESNLFQAKGPIVLSRDGEEVLPKLELNSEALSTLYNTKEDNITMNIPGPNGEIFKLLLTKVEIYASDFKVTDGTNIIDFPLGVHYFGVVEGKEDSRVIINIFQHEVNGIITIDNDPIELARDKSVRDVTEYSLHRASSSSKTRYCNTDTSKALADEIETTQITSKAVLSKYIRFQLEALDNNAPDITTLFTAVKDIYLNDPDVEVNLVLSGITLWTTSAGPSQIPFTYVSGNGADGANLDAYSVYRLNNILPNVDAYQFLPTGSLGGIAWLDRLCQFPPPSSKFGPFGISVINTGPTPAYTIYSWNASTVAHELGHNIGSRHTFDCVWTGPTGAANQSLGGCGIGIETCVACSSSNPFGTCTQPGENGYVYTSVNGATGLSGQTIMGYCSGYTPMVFGAQPGALIRNKVANASCLLCLDKNTIILMGDGTYKPIKDIKRGDLVMGDKEGLTKYKVAKVNISYYSPYKDIDLVVFEKGSLGTNIPTNKMIITGPHNIFYQGCRRAARCFRDFIGVTFHQKIQGGKLLEINEKGTIELYDLQFEDEGSYIAEGVQVESRSPWSIYTPLEKDLYYNQEMYTDERTIDSLKNIVPRNWKVIKENWTLHKVRKCINIT